jgi:hypothetical protein
MAKRKLGIHSLIFDDDEVIQLLRAAIERAGTQDAFARRYQPSALTESASSITVSVIGELIARVIDYARTSGHADRRAGHTGPTRRTGAACARCADGRRHFELKHLIAQNHPLPISRA